MAGSTPKAGGSKHIHDEEYKRSLIGRSLVPFFTSDAPTPSHDAAPSMPIRARKWNADIGYFEEAADVPAPPPRRAHSQGAASAAAAHVDRSHASTPVAAGGKKGKPRPAPNDRYAWSAFQTAPSADTLPLPDDTSWGSSSGSGPGTTSPLVVSARPAGENLMPHLHALMAGARAAAAVVPSTPVAAAVGAATRAGDAAAVRLPPPSPAVSAPVSVPAATPTAAVPMQSSMVGYGGGPPPSPAAMYAAQMAMAQQATYMAQQAAMAQWYAASGAYGPPATMPYPMHTYPHPAHVHPMYAAPAAAPMPVTPAVAAVMPVTAAAPVAAAAPARPRGLAPSAVMARTPAKRAPAAQA